MRGDVGDDSLLIVLFSLRVAIAGSLVYCAWLFAREGIALYKSENGLVPDGSLVRLGGPGRLSLSLNLKRGGSVLIACAVAFAALAVWALPRFERDGAAVKVTDPTHIQVPAHDEQLMFFRLYGKRELESLSSDLRFIATPSVEVPVTFKLGGTGLDSEQAVWLAAIARALRRGDIDDILLNAVRTPEDQHTEFPSVRDARINTVKKLLMDAGAPAEKLSSIEPATALYEGGGRNRVGASPTFMELAVKASRRDQVTDVRRIELILVTESSQRE